MVMENIKHLAVAVNGWNLIKVSLINSINNWLIVVKANFGKFAHASDMILLGLPYN